MNQTPATEPLQEIISLQPTYVPSVETAQTLQHKTLVMLIGPAAVGKSYVIEQTLNADPNFAQVTSFTTREPRADDLPGHIAYIPNTNEALSQLLQTIKLGSLVQYAVHSTTGNIYGTTPRDYTATYNMLPTLSTVVESLSALPFQRTVTICLVAKPETWWQWLNDRYKTDGSERTKRIQEAITSLRWMLSSTNPNIRFVENSVSNPQRTIEHIINIVKYNQQTDEKAREYAKQMLSLATNEGATTI